MLFDNTELVQMLRDIRSDANTIAKALEAPSFRNEVKAMVVDEVQDVFDSGGGPYNWPSHVDGVETGEMKRSWRVGGVDFVIYGDEIIFSTDVMYDYGQYFDGRYGLIGPEIMDMDLIADAFIDWVAYQSKARLDWRVDE